jgi:branched-chain amino acid transport system substrate-binding protein
MLGLSIVLAVTLAACASSSSTGSGSSGSSGSGTYTWGIDAELSGLLSFYGLGIQDGVSAYVNQVNATGGIDGHKIKLVSLDDAGDSSTAAANATQLATADGADAIFGHVDPANCSAAQPIIQRDQVPMACLSVGSPSSYVYSLGADDSYAAGALISTAKKLVAGSDIRAANFYNDSLTGIGLAKSLASSAPAAGVKIVTSQPINPAATDLSVPIAAIVASKPNVIFVSTTGPNFLTVLKGVRAAGVKAPLIWVDGTSNLASLADSADTGVYALVIYQLLNPADLTGAAKDYVTAAKSTLKDPTSATAVNAGYAIPSYMTAWAFGTALKACGYPCSGPQLKAHLDKLHIAIPGLAASFSYEASDHYPYTDWYVYHVVGTTTSLFGTYPAS